MQRKLIREDRIVAGETTCASKPGDFCRFVATRNFGTRYCCNLFIKDLTHSDRDKDGDGLGWLQRLPECIEAERLGAEHTFFVPHSG